MFKIGQVKKEMDFLFANINRKSTLPILNHIAINQSNGTVEFQTTDLMTNSTVRLPTIESKGTIKSTALLTKKIPRLDNTITFDGKHVNWNKVPLVTKDYEEFPAGLNFKTKIDVDPVFIDDLFRLLPFVSQDEMKPALCGFYVKGTRYKTELVGTDGHKLFEKTYQVKSQKHFEFILDRSAIPRLKQMLKLGKLDSIRTNKHDSGNGIVFTVGNHTLAVRDVDDRYPQYKEVIPDTTRKDMQKITFDVKPLIESLAYIRDVAPINNATKQITLNGNNAECSDPERDLFMDMPLPVNIPLRIGFNIEYLYSTVKAIKTEKCDWYFGSPTGASIFKPHGVDETLLLMPVRIDE